MTRLRETGRIKVPDPTILLTRTQPWSEGHIQRTIALRNEAGERVLVAEVPQSPRPADPGLATCSADDIRPFSAILFRK